MDMITPNAISQLVKPETQTGQFNPIVQVINIKQLKNDRYRAILSDGRHYVQGMLAVQVTSLVQSGELRENSLIHLEDYLRNEISGRTVIILLKIRLLDNAGVRLGEPLDIDGGRAGPPATTSAPQQPQHQPLYNSTNHSNTTIPPTNNRAVKPEGMKPYGSSPPRSNPYGSASSPRAHHPAPIVRSTHVEGSAITPIAGLNIYNSRWTIKARVTAKSDIRTWSNAKGEGSLFSVELLDQSGTDIRGTFFKEAVDKFYNILEAKKVYRFSGGRLKVANQKFNTCKSAFEITFDQNTEIHLDNDDNAIAVANYDFCKISDIENIEPNKNVDVLAMVKSVGDVAHIISKKTGQEMAKCDLILTDDSGTEITLTLWRTQAETAPNDFAGNPVVAFRRARVSDYGGRSLSAGSSVDVRPQIPEAEQLLQWWRSGGSAGMPTRSLSATRGSGGSMTPLVDRKSIEAIREENLGHINPDKGDYLSFKGTVTFFKKDREGGAWYTACANAEEPCKNRFKVTRTVDGNWHCDKCGQTNPTCVRRWIFSGVVEDETSSTWVSFFNEQAESILGITADVAYEQSHPEGAFDQNVYDGFFMPHMFTEWIMKCRVKNEMVNEESRVKTSAVNMWPVDYLKESKELLAIIESF